MGKSAAHAEDYLKEIYQNIRAFPTFDTLEVALLLANGSELSYGGYARSRVTRASGQWVVSGTTCTSDVDIDFPVCTSNGQTAAKFKVFGGIGGIGGGGAAPFTYEIGNGNLNNSVTISVGDTPKFLSGELTITES
tara:strand:- start:301 stop:708 length:408 start_codon:yes stop_codon:yes gene_type:complete